MAHIITGQNFSAGDQVTSGKLNNIIGDAKLDSDSITGTTLNLTNGELKVATNGITDNELNANSVTTAKIANDAVTYDKIQDVAASSVIGNTTGSTATPTNVAILDEANMASDSATALATQQSIKAYVDAQVGSPVSKYTSTWFNNPTGSPTGLQDGGTYNFSHTLGVTDILVQVYVSDNSSGTNPQLISFFSPAPGSVQTYGSTITNITSSTIEVQLSSYGYLDLSSIGYQSLTTFVGKYIRVVAIG